MTIKSNKCSWVSATNSVGGAPPGQNIVGLPIPFWHFGQQQQNETEEEEEEVDDFHNLLESRYILPDGSLSFFGGNFGTRIPMVSGRRR